MMRGNVAALALFYLATSLGGPWLPPAVTTGAAGVLLLALGVTWNRAGQPRSTGYLAALGLPLHLLILSLGGLSTPLAPAISIWLGLLAGRWPLHHVALLATGGLVWGLAVQALWGNFDTGTVVGAALIFMAGALPAYLLERRGRRVAPVTAAAAPELSTRGGTWTSGSRERAARRDEELAAMLGRVRESFAARRVVLWEVDPEGGRARPRSVSGDRWPPAVTLVGDPLRLALEESATLRLDTPPRWAVDEARVAITPIELPGAPATLLSIELPAEAIFPMTARLEDVAALVRAFLELQYEAELANRARERFDAVVGLLERLPIQPDPTAFAAQLAAAARDFTGSSGAAVVEWGETGGRVMALVGDDGGATPGTTFGPNESEVALAAMNAAPLARAYRGHRDALPIIAPGERWFAEPAAILVLPLERPTGGVVGALALWNAEPTPIDPEASELLQKLLPYAAMQLEQLQHYQPLQELAERDPLTGLYNRRIFEERLAAEELRFLRYGRSIGLFILDIDHFKEINDTYGHEAGDAVLRAVGGLLGSTLRATDLAARLGGEEFVALLPETTVAGALEIAERVRRSVAELNIEWQGQPIEVRCSIGVAACPESVVTPTRLPAAADAALYTAKKAGRDRCIAAPHATFHCSEGG